MKGGFSRSSARYQFFEAIGVKEATPSVIAREIDLAFQVDVFVFIG